MNHWKIPHSLLLLLSIFLLLGCPPKTPTEGLFPLLVTAKNNDMEPVPFAQVFVRGQNIGMTNDAGELKTEIRGTVGERVLIEVKGCGEDNSISFNKLLLLKKEDSIPKTIKIIPFLRYNKMVASQCKIPKKTDVLANNGGKPPVDTNNPTNNNGGKPPVDTNNPPNNNGGKPPVDTNNPPNNNGGKPPVDTNNPPNNNGGKPPVDINNPPNNNGGKPPVDTNNPPNNNGGKPPVDVNNPPNNNGGKPPVDINNPPNNNGGKPPVHVQKFEIKILITSNSPMVSVYLNKRKQGIIQSAGGKLEISLQLRSRNRKAKLTFYPLKRGYLPKKLEQIVDFSDGKVLYDISVEFKEPPAAPKGEYRLKISSNVGEVKVYKNNRYMGYIKEAGGSLMVQHKDRKRSPRAVVFKLKAKNRSEVKRFTLLKKVAINTQQEEYDISVEFEKIPPLQIAITTNIAGVDVYLNKKKLGTVQEANQALQLEYKGRKKRALRLDFVPQDSRARPRKISKNLRLRRGVTNYNVAANFKIPTKVAIQEKPPIDNNDNNNASNNGGGKPPIDNNNASNGGGKPPIDNNNASNGGGKPPVDNNNASNNQEKPPVDQGKPPVDTFDGKYVVQLASNVPAKVYLGRRKIGTIATAGSSVAFNHRDRKKNPRSLTFLFKALDKSAVSSASLSKKVSFEWGKREVSVQADFTMFEVAKIQVIANIVGAIVKLNGKKQGSTLVAGQALSFPYAGKKKTTLLLEILAPSKSFTPAKIKKKIRFHPKEKNYEVSVQFDEKVVDEVITPECFKKEKKLKIVTLYASAGSSMTLKGNCDEGIGKTNKQGALRIKMPVASIQRIVAMVQGRKIQKIIEVPAANTLKVRFTNVSVGCSLKDIDTKVSRKIRLSESEVNCLRKVPSASSDYFSATIVYARFLCQQKAYTNGKKSLSRLSQQAKYRFDAYKALQMGIEYGRCRQYDTAIRLLKQAERLKFRFHAPDRYSNEKSILKALANIYERRYYDSKSVVDLRLSQKQYKKLRDMTRSSDTGEKAKASKELERITKLLNSKGSMDE